MVNSQKSNSGNHSSPLSILQPTNPATHVTPQDRKGSSPSRSCRTPSDNGRKVNRHPGRRPHSSSLRRSGPHHDGPLRGEPTMERPDSPMELGHESVLYTRTGRISKAKKGLKVHQCELCSRTYSRAEHLRRHQRNHNEESLRCQYPGCGREFHRQDLLRRHQERHSQTKEPRRGSASTQSPTVTSEAIDLAIAPEIRTNVPASHLNLPVNAIETSTVFSSPLEMPLEHPSTSESRYKDSAFLVPSEPDFLSQFPHTCSKYNHPSSPSPFTTGKQTLAAAVADSCFEQSSAPIFKNPFSPSPVHYSSSSGAASPSYYDYNQLYLPAGHTGLHTRTSSNASLMEPSAWQFPESRSPTATSSMPNLWDMDPELSPELETVGDPMAMSPPLYPVPTSLSGGMATGPAIFGIFTNPLKTACERDEDDRILLFPDQSFGMDTGIQRAEEYLANYWSAFHPFFPLIHKTTFSTYDVAPLLKAAMLAIGAHACQDASGLAEARILHDRCLKVLSRRDIDVTWNHRLCDSQATFLVEYLSQYRGRRSPLCLSARFVEMYSSIIRDPESTNVLALQNLASVPSTADERIKHSAWDRWRNSSAKQRLLICCYILEAQQSTLLARNVQAPRVCGIDLPFPTPTSVWDAESAVKWCTLSRENTSGYHYLYEIPLTDSAVDHPSTTLDPFQSSLAIAAYRGSYNRSHSLGTSPSCLDLSRLLDPSPQTKLSNLTAIIVENTPVRALLAVSGGSWILTEKVTSISALSSLRSTLRAWIAEPHGRPSAFPDEGVAVDTPAQTAIIHALELLRLVIRISQASPPSSLHCTPEMELGPFYACLVLWTVATRFLSPSSNDPVPPHPFGSAALPLVDATLDDHPLSIPASVSASELMQREAVEAESLHFLDGVAAWLAAGPWTVAEDAPLPPVRARWRKGIAALVRWVRDCWLMRGSVADEGQPAHAALAPSRELLDAVVGVLGRLLGEVGIDERKWLL